MAACTKVRTANSTGRFCQREYTYCIFPAISSAVDSAAGVLRRLLVLNAAAQVWLHHSHSVMQRVLT